MGWGSNDVRKRQPGGERIKCKWCGVYGRLGSIYFMGTLLFFIKKPVSIVLMSGFPLEPIPTMVKVVNTIFFHHVEVGKKIHRC